MIKFICELCGKEYDHATFFSIIGNPAMTNFGFYICDNCKYKAIDEAILYGLDNRKENSNV